MKKSLKNIAILAILTIILITLTGCANVNYDIKLNEDGSGDIVYTMGYDKSFLKSMGVETSAVAKDDSLKDMKEEAKEKGYTIEDYEDDTTYGFKASKHVNNIQEEFNVNDEVSDDNEESGKIIYEKTLLKTRYYQDSKVDLTDILSDNEEAAMLKAVMSQMKVSYRITLPFRVGSNNATIVSEDGKTIEWILKVSEVNEIKFEASQDYGMYALAGLLIIVILIVTAVVLSKKAKKTVVVKPVEVKKEEIKPEEKETQADEKTQNVKVEEETKIEAKEVVPEESTVEKEEVIKEENTNTEEIIEDENVEETVKDESKEEQENVVDEENKEE